MTATTFDMERGIDIFQKIGVRDRVELTLHAIRAGIVGVNDRRC